MKNYERYQNVTPEEYEKKGIMDYLVKGPSDRKMMPLILNIKNKRILDVGLGTGFYTKELIKNNQVVGIDQNPSLCKLPIKVYKGDATELSGLVADEKFDIVFSTWMTEYLNSKELETFFYEARKVSADKGKLITTVISRYGYGFIYVSMAKIVRNISKYSYSQSNIVEKLKKAGFTDINLLNLNGCLNLPWAYLVIAE